MNIALAIMLALWVLGALVALHLELRRIQEQTKRRYPGGDR